MTDHVAGPNTPASSTTIAELLRLCADDYASTTHLRSPGEHPAPARHCPAAFPTDPTPCRGPVAVTVLDSENAGADGCEYHAARLLASLDGGHVHARPDGPDGAALRVFKAAGGGERQ
jgi:hypothetical protein